MSTLPFVDLQAQRHRIEALLRRRMDAVLEHGRFIQGPEVAELEAALSARAPGTVAVSCGSGTDALVMALMALGVGPGDAVLVPSFTFVATAEAVVLVGATPVFCDVRPETFNIDPDEVPRGIAAAIDAGLRPVGVIPVDLFGLPAEYERVESHAAHGGLWVLADAAQSIGGAIDEHPVGTLAPMTATSFFPAKPLGCYGDGGAVYTTSDDGAEVLRSIREHGKGGHKYETVRIGINGRLDTLQAAVLLAKLEVFDDEIERRGAVARRYEAGLCDVARVPVLPPGCRSAWAQYTVLIEDRDRVGRTLAEQGIPTAVYYPRPLHLQAPYSAAPRTTASLAVSERLSQQVLSLPMHPYLDAPVQDRIVQLVRQLATVRGSA